MQLILDIGSGRSLPDVDTAIKLIDEVIKRDTGKHEVIFKAQLFESAPPNVPLSHIVFRAAFVKAEVNGYHLTSSVFDKESLRVLLKYDYDSWPLPFIKIACRPDLYWLIGEIPRKIPVYCSTTPNVIFKCLQEEEKFPWDDNEITYLTCVRKYPASLSDYMNAREIVDVDGALYSKYVSDHTQGWEMFSAMEDKEIWEKHVCLEHNDTNPDAGAFAVTPEELEEIL